MGAAPSTPRLGAEGAASLGAAEQMFAALVGEKAYPISSEFWRQLLELPLTLQWLRERVLQACRSFGLTLDVLRRENGFHSHGYAIR